jgi:hypothetical protein
MSACLEDEEANVLRAGLRSSGEIRGWREKSETDWGVCTEFRRPWLSMQGLPALKQLRQFAALLRGKRDRERVWKSLQKRRNCRVKCQPIEFVPYHPENPHLPFLPDVHPTHQVHPLPRAIVCFPVFTDLQRCPPVYNRSKRVRRRCKAFR